LFWRGRNRVGIRNEFSWAGNRSAKLKNPKRNVWGGGQQVKKGAHPNPAGKKKGSSAGVVSERLTKKRRHTSKEVHAQENSVQQGPRKEMKTNQKRPRRKEKNSHRD